jgi:hypothetical protein
VSIQPPPRLSPAQLPSVLEIVRGDEWRAPRFRLTNRARSTLDWAGNSVRFEVHRRQGDGLPTILLVIPNVLTAPTGWVDTVLSSAQTTATTWTRGIGVWILVSPTLAERTILRATLEVRDRAGR